MHTMFGAAGIYGLIALYSVPMIITLVILVVSVVKKWYSHWLLALFAFFLAVFAAATWLTLSVDHGYLSHMPMFQRSVETPGPAMPSGMKMGLADIGPFAMTKGFTVVDDKNILAAACETGTTCRVYANQTDEMILVVNDDGVVRITVLTPSGVPYSKEQIQLAKTIITTAYTDDVTAWFGSHLSALDQGRQMGQVGGLTLICQLRQLSDGSMGLDFYMGPTAVIQSLLSK